MFNQKLMDRWMDTEELSVIEEALRENKGVIFASGHFGNWEWLGGALSVKGWAMTYVVTAQSNPFADRWLSDMRRSLGAEIVYKKDAVRGVIRALKNNRVIAMLNDQDAHESGVFVPFFGRLASTPRGVAVFHLKTGCPVVFGKTIARKDGKYQIHLERLRFDNLTGNREQDEYLIMTKITARLEEEIRHNPEQWLWLHRRWKTKPP
jgi:KDO2-lipid IV(A) lauroyltransferase